MFLYNFVNCVCSIQEARCTFSQRRNPLNSAYCKSLGYTWETRQTGLLTA